MFTYFYKFRSVNCMHYLKCSTKYYITQLWQVQKISGIFDHYFVKKHTHQMFCYYLQFGVKLWSSNIT